MQREVLFSYNTPLGIKVPYVREVLDYANDGSGGYLEFDGYWYRHRVEYDEVVDADGRVRYMRNDIDPLPCELIFTTKLVDLQPFETEVDSSGDMVEYFRLTEREEYRILATTVTEVCDTSEYCSDEEDGGHICFFPTARQRIDFRVIERLECEPTDVRTVSYGTRVLPCSEAKRNSASVSVDSSVSD